MNRISIIAALLLVVLAACGDRAGPAGEVDGAPVVTSVGSDFDAEHSSADPALGVATPATNFESDASYPPTDVPEVDRADVVAAWELWRTARPDAYYWNLEGAVDGAGFSFAPVVRDDEIVQRSGSDTKADLTVDRVYTRILAALDAGSHVELTFHKSVGFPTTVVIGTGGEPRSMNLITRDFVPIVQPDPCPSGPGAATDLDAEPIERLVGLFGTKPIRWVDDAGCPVRIDVISHYMGAKHCGWETSEFITIGVPIGAPIRDDGESPEGARTYIWDPNMSIDSQARNVSIPLSDLPSSADDTDYRTGSAEMWLDSADPNYLYRVHDGRADRFVLDPARSVMCY